MTLVDRKHFLVLFGIAVLAIVAFLPTLTQPFIEDDYANIKLARTYGPVSGWGEMMRDDVNRVRTTTWVMTYWIDRVSGFEPWAFYAVGILLHVFNCWLIYAFGRLNTIGYAISGWAAAFFAIQEGHQEAVMWYSACNELLLFLFGMSCVLAWIRFVERDELDWKWYEASLVLFILSLASKESSVVFVPLIVLVTFTFSPHKKRVWYALPFAVLASIYVTLIFAARQHSFRFSDQSFELDAPFWITWSRSFFALLWFWGLIALAALIIWRKHLRLILFALLWIAVSFVPYMFVAYMHRIPSRQTYLASFGLALIVGAAIVAMRKRLIGKYAWVAYSVLAIILIHNVGYLWYKKRPQFLERADPTEQLVKTVKQTDGPIYVECFPRDKIHAESAVELRLTRSTDTLIWTADEAARHPGITTFCYDESTHTATIK